MALESEISRWNGFAKAFVSLIGKRLNSCTILKVNYKQSQAPYYVSVSQMSNRQLFTASLIGLLVVGLVFAVLPISYAQDNGIFGYPYYTTQASGSGAKYDSHGSRFSLNNDADITSISCLMNGGFSPTEPNDRYIYRFAIYTDNNGKVGTLISQTETGMFIGKAGGSNDVWNAASFSQTVHLGSGVYWLQAVHNASGYIMFHKEYPADNYTSVTSVIGSMDFPTTMNNPVYGQGGVFSIYALGTGTSSISQPITNGQQVSRLSVGCTTDSSSANRILITGNLSANYIGISSAPILLSYADNPNATWQEIGEKYTGLDGGFTSSWYPPGMGNYVINATYTGDSNHTAETTLANVIVTSTASKSQTVFSVDSNSTISSLDFNSQTNQLSFSVSGETGTTGYSEIYISKSLIDDPSKIQASIDGQTANFTVTSIEDAWVLYFSYHHSSHAVVCTLNSQTNSTPTSTSLSATPEIPELTLPIIAIVLVVATVFGVVALKRRHLQAV